MRRNPEALKTLSNGTSWGHRASKWGPKPVDSTPPDRTTSGGSRLPPKSVTHKRDQTPPLKDSVEINVAIVVVCLWAESCQMSSTGEDTKI